MVRLWKGHGKGYRKFMERSCEGHVNPLVSMCLTPVRCVMLRDVPSVLLPPPVQPRRALGHGEPEDQHVGPGRVSEEERRRAARPLPPQRAQPDAHVEAAGGTAHTHTHTHTHTQRWYLEHHTDISV